MLIGGGLGGHAVGGRGAGHVRASGGVVLRLLSGPGAVVVVVGRAGWLRGVSGSTGVGHIVGVRDGREGPLDLTMGTTGHRVGGARCRIHGCSEEERR